MLNGELWALSGLAVSIGFTHTLFGPDHYLPFLAIGKARSWTLRKTLIITFLCGIGHILSSVVVGAIGIALGLAVFRLESFESFRGSFVGWLLMAFGLAYLVWGVRTARRKRRHAHAHDHGDGTSHEHEHTHLTGHSHAHLKDSGANITPWVLFTIFVFGPCEPLIPVLMYPAAKHDWFGVVLATSIFGVITISTMLVLVTLGHKGLGRVRLGVFEQYSHALAGAAILLTGLAVQFLGL